LTAFIKEFYDDDDDDDDDKFHENHLQTGDIPINWRRRRFFFAKCQVPSPVSVEVGIGLVRLELGSF